MANSKISELNEALSVNDIDVFPIVQSGQNKKVLHETIKENVRKFSDLTEKISLIGDDLILVNDSENTNTPVYTKFSNIVGSIENSLDIPNFKIGCALSNNGTDPNNDIDISAGKWADSTYMTIIILASVITKRLDASWAVGTNQGGLDTGSKANSTWYYLYLIKRSDTGVVDVLFSTNSINPTMPANYDYFRKIGAVVTDSSGNIRTFTQIGNEFRFKTYISDRTLTGVPNTTRNVLTVTCPPNSIGYFEFTFYIAAGAGYCWVSDTVHTDAAASISNQTGGSSSSYLNNSSKYIFIDGSSQIAYRADTTAMNLQIKSIGFKLEL